MKHKYFELKFFQKTHLKDIVSSSKFEDPTQSPRHYGKCFCFV